MSSETLKEHLILSNCLLAQFSYLWLYCTGGHCLPIFINDLPVCIALPCKIWMFLEIKCVQGLNAPSWLHHSQAPVLCMHVCMCVCISVFSISSYGTPLAQRASYLTQHSFLYRPDGTVNYGYIITICINCLLIVSSCIPNGSHFGRVLE